MLATVNYNQLSIMDFRSKISETLNSKEIQIINIKKGQKKALVDFEWFIEALEAKKLAEWQEAYKELSGEVSTAVKAKIGKEEYNRISNLDMDTMYDEASKL